VFFSHNNSARTVFFSQFQLKFSKPNRTIRRTTVRESAEKRDGHL